MQRHSDRFHFPSPPEPNRKGWSDHLSALMPALLILGTLGLNGLILAAVTPSDISDSLRSPQGLIGSIAGQTSP